MNMIRNEKNVAGLPLPNETRLVLSNILPSSELITCSFVLAFQEDALLLTNLYDRGWDIPGGHIERGESPAQAMQRELYEETGALIESPHVLGYELIRLFSKPIHYKYPFPDSYMVFYCAKIVRMDAFEGNIETKGRGFFKPEDAYHIPWVKGNRAFYEEALKWAISESKVE
ncbi:8-oxo-dGTP pyrophosphatase MutT (NUDIX family) [Paenibacillus castaneae]|uniref:NUDIX domain-containing protein n=1 Tax=Paenibacillus castaneae TaxID=474957 RepID=UPI000C9994F3|nr:NUDIX domain-containing protein [Paenibacillus castaneae]NIK76141.1 8-oxo-dGTP pyrophosphatase MutT (NUDIX family) [Paenibacillus castaneae]